jgi:hypothetical protein
MRVAGPFSGVLPYRTLPMKTLLCWFTVMMISCSLAQAGGIKEKLIGKWTTEAGEGATKSVTTLEFKEDGSFTKTAALGTRVMTAIIGGKWLLTTEATGLKAVTADPNKLILTYQVMESTKLTSKTEAWLVIISNDKTFDGKETLRLAPLDGALIGTNYYFRAK